MHNSSAGHCALPHTHRAADGTYSMALNTGCINGTPPARRPAVQPTRDCTLSPLQCWTATLAGTRRHASRSASCVLAHTTRCSCTTCSFGEPPVGLMRSAACSHAPGPACTLSATGTVSHVPTSAGLLFLSLSLVRRPSEQELAEFNEPDFTIYNAGACSVASTLQSLCCGDQRRQQPSAARLRSAVRAGCGLVSCANLPRPQPRPLLPDCRRVPRAPPHPPLPSVACDVLLFLLCPHTPPMRRRVSRQPLHLLHDLPYLHRCVAQAPPDGERQSIKLVCWASCWVLWQQGGRLFDVSLMHRQMVSCCSGLAFPAQPKGACCCWAAWMGRGAGAAAGEAPGAPPFLPCLQVILGTQQCRGQMEKGVFRSLTNCCSPCCACRGPLPMAGYPGHPVRGRDEEGRVQPHELRTAQDGHPVAALGLQRGQGRRRHALLRPVGCAVLQCLRFLCRCCDEGKDGDVTLFFGLSGVCVQSCSWCQKKKERRNKTP